MPLSGQSQSGEKDVVEMLDIQKIEEERFDFVEESLKPNGEGSSSSEKVSMVVKEEMFIDSETARDEL